MEMACKRILTEGIDEPLKSFYLPGSPGAPCMYSDDLPVSSSPAASSEPKNDDFIDMPMIIWDPAKYYRT